MEADIRKEEGSSGSTGSGWLTGDPAPRKRLKYRWPTTGAPQDLRRRLLSQAIVTTKVTTISGDGSLIVGVCTEEEPNCTSRRMPLVLIR